jgi:hypothetical protein
MAKLTTAEELDIAIKAAARDADPGLTSREIAAELYRSEPELIEAFRDDWITDKLASLIAKHRTAIRRADSPQLVFEEMLGFARLPARFPSRSGKPIPREVATIGAVRRLRIELRKKGHPALKEADHMIALMEKHVKKNHRITWGEVVQREAEKAKSRGADKLT